MNPREFLEAVVRPNIVEFHTHFGDLRHAHNAVSAMDALAAHIYVWAKAHSPVLVASCRDDTDYRNRLAKRDQSFALLRDIAKAQKHIVLERGSPLIGRADQTTARTTGWGEGRWGEARWGDGKQVVVDRGPDGFSYLETIIDASLALLETELTGIGL